MIQLEPIYEPIRHDLVKVESILEGIVNEADPFLAGALRRALSPRGKRLRPALLILSSNAVNGATDVSRAAAAVELVHSAALLHDDVVDHAETRRGSLTAKEELGDSLSIVLGNYLYSRAFGLMPNSNRLRHLLLAATTAMCSGEAHELARRGVLNIGPGDYIHVAGKKTAVLTSACCAMGASLGKADPEVCSALACYGLLLGLAFQIRDDCLDIKGEKETMGKGCCRDFAEGNATLPLILALPLMNRNERRKVRSVFNGCDEAEATWLAQTVERRGGIQKSMLLAKDFSKRAVGNLEAVHESEAKESLRLLAAYSVERDT
ncbi:MAG: polyprenyl synthetase family protein [bacterium]